MAWRNPNSRRRSAWRMRAGEQTQKFKSQRVEHAGMSFPSKLEAATYQMFATDPNVEILQTQAHVKLSRANITYIADFKLRDRILDKEFYAEAKGYETDVWKLKRKLWAFYGPGELHVYKGTWKNPVLAEIIRPGRIDLCPHCGLSLAHQTPTPSPAQGT